MGTRMLAGERLALRLAARCGPDFLFGLRLGCLDLVLTTLFLLLHPAGQTFMGSPVSDPDRINASIFVCLGDPRVAPFFGDASSGSSLS